MRMWIALTALLLTVVAGSSSADEAAELEAVLNSGDAKSQFDLGVRYIHGKGVEKDLAIAEKLLRSAASNDHPLAMNNLGIVIRFRASTRKNFVEATKWFRAAADKGLADAQYNGDYIPKSQSYLAIILYDHSPIRNYHPS